MARNEDEKKPEGIMFSKDEVAALVKAAVTSAFEALKAPPEAVAKSDKLDATAGMTDAEKEEFHRSFGGGTCPECNQPAIKGRYACKGKHTKMVVYPQDPYWGTYFQGVCIGGAWYLSDGPGHEITVPFENSIRHEVDKWMDMERTNAQGRRKSHKSGSIGPNGRNTNSFNEPGWR